MRIGAGAAVAVLIGVITAQAQGDLCQDPATFCRQSLSSDCMQRFGAGVLAPADAATAALQGDCAQERDAYFECVARAAEECGADAAATGPACDAATARALWTIVEKDNDCGAYAAFLQACPAETLAPFARNRMQALGCGSAPALSDFARFQDCAGCPEMIALPAGAFRMGADDGEDLEKPPHRVSVPRFAIGRAEVTVGEFRLFVEETGRVMGSSCWVPNAAGDGDDVLGAGWDKPGFEQSDDHPVVCVTLRDAEDYASWLNRKSGAGYRLPSEAEWEYAARAGTSASYSWGEEASHDRANYGADNCCKGFAAGPDRWVQSAPVGSFPANPFGLVDMAGNVWEWIEDCWNASYSDAPSDGSAWRRGDCARTSLRGGAWNTAGWDMRSSNRLESERDGRDASVGFRIARALSPE